MIDPSVADVQWATNTRVRVQPGRQSAAPEDEPGPPSTHPAAGAYESSRARREAAEAALAELRLAEQRGELVRLDAIRNSVARMMTGARESLLQIPARVAPVLAAEGDARVVHDTLERELHEALREAVYRYGPEE